MHILLWLKEEKKKKTCQVLLSKQNLFSRTSMFKKGPDLQYETAGWLKTYSRCTVPTHFPYIKQRFEVFNTDFPPYQVKHHDKFHHLVKKMQIALGKWGKGCIHVFKNMCTAEQVCMQNVLWNIKYPASWSAFLLKVESIRTLIYKKPLLKREA